MVRYHIVVHGVVQGVGFRYYTYQNAINNNITGWVRNRNDGTVEIEAVGTREDFIKFIDFIKKGSNFSNVERVNIQETEKPRDYDSFQIKY